MSHEKSPRTVALGHRVLAVMTASVLLLPAAWASTPGGTAKKTDSKAAATTTGKPASTATGKKATTTAGTSKKKHHKKHVAAKAPAPGSAGMTVSKDPVSGVLRSATPQEQLSLQRRSLRLQPDQLAARRAQVLAAEPPRNSKSKIRKVEAAIANGTAVQQVTYENGMVGVQLDDSFSNYAVASKSADGKVALGCLDNKKQKDEFMKNATKGKKVNPVAQQEVASDR